MANKMSTYIILTALLMMLACVPSHAQFACSGNDSNNATIVCSKGMELCNGACTNISTESNCGGCADRPDRGDHVCKLKQKCCDGVCCLPDEVCCNGKCTDTYNDPNNCGGCGNVSSRKNICQPGQICCEGGCADTLLDDNNCGECGNVCSPGAHCIDGECLSSGSTEGIGEETEDTQE